MPSPTTPEPLRILGRANSFNVRKVLWVCDELGIPYQREDYGRGFKACDSPEFLALNPTAQVPVVIDGDVVLRESNAIVRYLAAKMGAVALYPTDLVARQRVEQWMDWIAYDLTHALRGAFLAGQLHDPEWDNPWFIKKGQADLIHEIGILDAHLAVNGPYVTGESFTVADIPVGMTINRWFMLSELRRPEMPACGAYYALLSQRPAFLRHVRNGLP